MILLEDIKSNFYKKANVTYGSKGDKVKLVTQHDQVLIVENSKGIKFSVHKNKVA